MFKAVRVAVATFFAAAAFAACGGGDDPAVGTSGASSTTNSRSGPTPERIVSLSATATEMLFAIGAGEQVIAVDDQSNFPPDAPMTDLSSFKLSAITEFPSWRSVTIT